MLEIIQFIGPVITTDDGGVAYRATVNHQPVSCQFSAECLQDVNPSLRGATPLQQFDASREKLLSIAEGKIRAGDIEKGLVRVLTIDLWSSFGSRVVHPVTTVNSESNIHPIGHPHGDLSLRALSGPAYAMVIPSRQGNRPNTGVEGHACATPVIAFQTGGLPDIVEQQRTGYLANAFDTEDLAEGIAFVLDQRNTGMLGDQVREKAVKQFSYEVIAPQYMAVYGAAVENRRS